MSVKVKSGELTKKHEHLSHSENMKVVSHVQRPSAGWIINTIMVEGYDIPFRFKRKTAYKNMQGQRVNLTYYPMIEKLAGLDFEYMKVVRIKAS